MILQPTFDPTNPISGTFNLNLTGGYGKAVYYNESNSNLKLKYSNGFTDYLPAWTATMICFINIPLTNPLVEYSTLSTLSNIVVTPISQVAIVTYEASEHIPGTYPAALVRSLSIGNTVNSTTSTNQVTNDGNPAVTTFIEATQQSNTGGSNVAIGNDGSFTFAQWQNSAFDNLLQLIPSASSPLLRLGAGLVLEAVDQSGLNLSNIFGIDSSGNTFLQNHKTNNQTVIYDKLGNAILTLDANKCAKIAGKSQIANGDTSGTMILTEMLYGAFKVAMVSHNNYRQNAATPQTLVLSNTFSGPFLVIAMGNGTLQIQNGASVQSGNYLNAMTATGSAFLAESTIGQCVIGWNNTAIDRIVCPGSLASAHTGAALFIGF